MLKEGHQQRDLTYLSSFICKVMKRRLGKGPEHCNIVVRDNLVIVKVHNFITPAEEVLCKKDQLSLALKFRSVLIKAIIEEVKADITLMTNIEIKKSYFDWDYEQNVGLILFAGAEQLPGNVAENSVIEFSFTERVKEVSGIIHKRPSDINLIVSESTVHVVECSGALIKMESLLFENGYEDLLHERAQEMRKNYNEYRSDFESILGQSINQLFVTWDYEKNKSYIVFFVK